MQNLFNFPGAQFYWLGDSSFRHHHRHNQWADYSSITLLHSFVNVYLYTNGSWFIKEVKILISVLMQI